MRPSSRRQRLRYLLPPLNALELPRRPPKPTEASAPWPGPAGARCSAPLEEPAVTADSTRGCGARSWRTSSRDHPLRPWCSVPRQRAACSRRALPPRTPRAPAALAPPATPPRPRRPRAPDESASLASSSGPRAPGAQLRQTRRHRGLPSLPAPLRPRLPRRPRVPRPLAQRWRRRGTGAALLQLRARAPPRPLRASERPPALRAVSPARLACLATRSPGAGTQRRQSPSSSRAATTRWRTRRATRRFPSPA